MIKKQFRGEMYELPWRPNTEEQNKMQDNNTLIMKILSKNSKCQTHEEHQQYAKWPTRKMAK